MKKLFMSFLLLLALSVLLLHKQIIANAIGSRQTTSSSTSSSSSSSRSSEQNYKGQVFDYRSNCLGCYKNQHCTKGLMCIFGKCRAPCGLGYKQNCPAGQACANGFCACENVCKGEQTFNQELNTCQCYQGSGMACENQNLCIAGRCRQFDPQGIYQILTQKNLYWAMQVLPNANIVINQSDQAILSQHFRFIPVRGKDVTYNIQSVATGKYVRALSTGNIATIQVDGQDPEAPLQQFDFIKFPNSELRDWPIYALMIDGYGLDIFGGSINANQRIIFYTQFSSANQIWRMHRVK